MEEQQGKILSLGKPLLALLLPLLMLVCLFSRLPQVMEANPRVQPLATGAEGNRPYAQDYLTGVATCEQAPNLVPNPSFEDGSLGSEGWDADHWRESGDCLFSYDDPGRDSGHAARIFAGHVREETCRVRTATGAIPVEPGRFYDYSAWVKTAALQGEAYLKIRFEPDGAAYTAPVTDTGGAWVKMTGSVQAPADAEHVRVEATVSASSLGLAWFDDIHVGLATCMTIDKRDRPDEVSHGQLLTYTLVYSNAGREKATDVLVVDRLDDYVSKVSAFPPPVVPSTTVWLFPEVLPQASGTLTLVVRVADDTAERCSLVNYAQVIYDEFDDEDPFKGPIYVTETTVISPCDGCDLNLIVPDPDKSVGPGEAVPYELLVNNVGSCAGAIGIEANSGRGWSVLIEPDSFSLAARSSRTVVVSPVVPQCALSGTVDVTPVTVTLDCDPLYDKTVTKTVAVTTTVKRASGVDIEPDLVKPPPVSGTTVAFVHTVTNTGNWTDTMTLTAAFPDGIPVTIEPGQVDDLGPCSSRPVTVTVGNLTSASELTGVITATCASDPGRFDAVVDEIEIWRLYWPQLMIGYCPCAPDGLANNCFLSPCALAPPWGGEGSLGRKVVRAEEDAYSPFGCCAAQLGDPAYGNRNVPVGRATIYQTVQVTDTPAPKLELVYAVYSYDLMQGQRTGKLYDSFEVAVNDLSGNVIFRTGNPEGEVPSDCRSEAWRSGVQTAWLDLSAYAGQTISLYFSVWNRVDRNCNTWAYIDSVRIVP